MKDAHLAPGLSGGSKDRIAEVLFSNHLRAREGEEDAPRLNLLKGTRIETGIALQRIVQCPAMLGKGRWVEDDEVVGKCRV